MTQRDKRLMIVLGTVVVLALGFLFLKSRGSSGGSATPAAAAPAAPSAPAPVPSPARTRGESKAAPLSEGRDPFVNLFPAPSPPAPPAPPVDVSPTPSPSPTPTPSPSPSTTPTTPFGGSTATIGGKEVTLLSIFTEDGAKIVHVKVDDARYDAEEGATFDQGYRVTTIEDPCADFTWQTDSFRLCTGPPSN